MSKRLALPALLAPALLLAGCGSYNGGVESVYQPVVQRSDYVLDLQSQGYALAPGETQRLAGWMQAMNLRYGDRVALDDGGDGTVGRDEVRAAAGRYGLLVADRPPTTVGEVAPGTVRVVVTRMTASVPNCPDRSGNSQPDFSATTSSNYGCAVNSNLAAMIADPNDLVRGAPGSTTSDPAAASKAIKVYRDTPPTGTGGLRTSGTAGGTK